MRISFLLLSLPIKGAALSRSALSFPFSHQLTLTAQVLSTQRPPTHPLVYYLSMSTSYNSKRVGGKGDLPGPIAAIVTVYTGVRLILSGICWLAKVRPIPRGSVALCLTLRSETRQEPVH